MKTGMRDLLGDPAAELADTAALAAPVPTYSLTRQLPAEQCRYHPEHRPARDVFFHAYG